MTTADRQSAEHGRLQCRRTALLFDEYFSAFIERVLGSRPLAVSEWHSLTSGERSFDTVLEANWLQQTLTCVARADERCIVERAQRWTRLRDAIDRTAIAVDANGPEDFVSGRVTIVPQAEYMPADGRDFFYFKINHGYWEQLLALFCTPESASPRLDDVTCFRGHYLECWFLEALDAQILDSADDDGHVVQFPGVHFGVSFSNGDVEHRDLVENLPFDELLSQQVFRGTAIGLPAYFESLFGPRQLSFCEGSFPKHGLVTGMLQRSLLAFAAASDRIVVVVPPHLEGVRIVGTNVPHEHLLISGSMVHESWIVGLYVTAGRIIQRLANGERVMVVTQSAAFAALLALFLKSAKKALVPLGSLSFFDLGQVLDIATPRTGGHWVRRRDRLNTIFSMPQAEVDPGFRAP